MRNESSSQTTSKTEPVHGGPALGTSLPDSPHAVSVALPRWLDVVHYEEKDPATMARLRVGYPRFVIHNIVESLSRAIAPSEPHCLPLPSESAASDCVGYIRRRTGANATVIRGKGLPAVATDESGKTALKEYWQHTGMIVSSRQAAAALNGNSRNEVNEAHAALRKTLAQLYGCEPGDVFLQPSGMAAHYAALKAVTRRTPGAKSIQVGFPYVDTLKLQQKFASGATLLHDLSRTEDDTRRLLRTSAVSACFSEVPGNPLLGSANLRRISPLLREKHVPLVADDVVATPVNVDLSSFADLISTSLTKFISGSGDVMGGALICNPRSPLHGELKALIDSQHEELLWFEDAQRVLELASSFTERMSRHNASGLFIAERLRDHPAVERVWYPKWEFNEEYEAVRRQGGGYGALITFLPKNASTAAPNIYDRLNLCKGPSLGTTFTLACPFTLLAHYTELDWAQDCGVPRDLIRISVGLEDPEQIWQAISRALSQT